MELGDLQEELDLKVAKALDALSGRHDRGDLTTASYVHSLEAVDNATRGIVDNKLSLYIDEEMQRHDYKPAVEVLVAERGEKNLVVIQRIEGNDFLDMNVYEVGDHKHVRKEFEEIDLDPVRAAKDQFANMEFAINGGDDFKRVTA